MITDDVMSIKHLIMELNEQEGSAIPIEQVKNLASSQGFSAEKVDKAIDALVEEGILAKLDNDTVEVTE